MVIVICVTGQESAVSVTATENVYSAMETVSAASAGALGYVASAKVATCQVGIV